MLSSNSLRNKISLSCEGCSPEVGIHSRSLNSGLAKAMTKPQNPPFDIMQPPPCASARFVIPAILCLCDGTAGNRTLRTSPEISSVYPNPKRQRGIGVL
jgi:hypothetical protein